MTTVAGRRAHNGQIAGTRAGSASRTVLRVAFDRLFRIE